MSKLQDTFGRNISYLRLSVTDRCNFRCFYCLPRSFRDFEVPEHWLLPEEIERVVRAFSELGVRHVRLTGGEPTVRRELPEITRRLNALPGLDDLSLSTNAARLDVMADELRDAGIRRVNVSLDSLDEKVFKQITGGDLGKVLNGLAAAKRAGLEPVKINMVVMRGQNDHEVEAMTEFCMQHGYALRFIETMPVGDGGRDAVEHFVDLEEVRVRLDKRFGLRKAAMRGSGPARYYQVGDSALTVGFITPQSQHFCATCNRVRLSVDGTVYLCLGQEDKVELRPLLRDGASLEELKQTIVAGVSRKPERHEFTLNPDQINRPMAALGG